MEEGMSQADARQKIWMSDKYGLLVQVVEFLYSKGMAFRYPEPLDKEAYVKSIVWNTEYDSFLPDIYEWPGVSHSPIVE
ncbi:NAD-dependent malic enzyme, mitochondrial-like [Trichomycterus rosablanca]|uniref:NAD-dependent malic enzyme, mitochondrial-like n=1 Tax=Trichomycterus rosablanca TaxID=2290929 RepID=UPI002F35F614